MVREFDAVFSVQCTLYREGGRGCASNSGTLASNRQNTASPGNNDISLLISHHSSLMQMERRETAEKRWER
jgi:hypothetical protein